MPSVASGLSRRFEVGLTRSFAALGLVVATWPWATLGASSVVCGALGTGLALTRVESDDDVLYTPRHSREAERVDWAARTFVKSAEETEGRSKGVSLIGEKATTRNKKKKKKKKKKKTTTKTKNLLSDRSALLKLFEVTTACVDLCSRTEECALNGYGFPIVLSATGRWNSSEALAADGAWRTTLLQGPLASSYFDRNARTAVDDKGVAPVVTPLDYVVGGLEYENDATSGPYVASAKALAAKVVLRGDASAGTMRAMDALIAAHSDNELAFYVHSKTSYRDAAMGAIAHDGTLVLVACGLLVNFATACFACSARTNRARRLLYGPAAIASVLLALIASFGTWMAAGGAFHALMGAAIFMVLGLGVDDAFVIIAALDDEKTDDGAAVRVSRALGSAGVSILLTSVTDAAAFTACACATSIPALRSFCAVAALSIACDFAMQCTFFVAIAALIERRTPSSEDDALFSAHHDGPAAAAGGGGAPSRSVMERWASFVLSHGGSIVVVASAAALVALGAVGAARLRVDFNTAWMMPEGSGVARARALEVKYFEQATTWLVPVYTRGGQLTPANVDSYRRAVEAVARLPFNAEDLNNNKGGGLRLWMDSVEPAPNATAFEKNALAAARQSKWVAKHLAFTTDGGGPKRCSTLAGYSPSNDTAAAPRAVCATQDTLKWKATDDAGRKLEMLRRAQRRLDKHSGARHLDAFVPSTASLSALASTRPQTVESLKYVAAVVFLCCTVLMGDLGAALLMLLVLAAVDLVLVGSLYWIGESFNMVTTVIMTLAIGLACDFSAHVTHAYLVELRHLEGGGGASSSASARLDATHAAIRRIGVPVVEGALSTLVAVLPMARSQSYVIRLFFVMCFSIVLCGLFAGLAVVPVILAHTPRLPACFEHETTSVIYSPLTNPTSQVLGGLVELHATTATPSSSSKGPVAALRESLLDDDDLARSGDSALPQHRRHHHPHLSTNARTV